MPYSARERLWLWILAILGFAGLNGAFLWALITRPDAAFAVMRDPVAAAFIVEALVMVGVLGYLFARWKVSSVHWLWFVLLSLAGGLAFAVPVVLLWTDRRRQRGTRVQI